MLTNSLKISDITKKEFFELKFFQINKKNMTKLLCEDFSSVSQTLTC